MNETLPVSLSLSFFINQPGDVVGHVGLDRAAESGGRVVDNRLPTMIITGYPADFLRGEMVTSGLCDPGKPVYLNLPRF